jgi:hypothetical protein
MARTELTARFVSPEKLGEWGEALKRCPWRDFCATPLWIEAFPRAWGPLRVVGVFRKDELIGGATFAPRRRLGQRVLTTHPMTPYAGLWVAEPPDVSASRRESLCEAVVGALDSFLGSEADEALLRLDPRFADARPFLKRGWEATVQHTYVTELDSGASEESAFENDARRQIAKARRKGIRVEEDGNWRGFSSRAQATLARKGLRGKFPQGFIEQLGQALEAHGAGTLLSAISPEGLTLASAIVVWEGERAIYLYGASTAAAEGTGAPSLLQAEILRRLKNVDGVKAYDWHGANAPSVARFKKNFNPRVQSYFVLRKCYGLPLGVAHAMRNAIRRWKTGRKVGKE